jgi:hypothetical protein
MPQSGVTRNRVDRVQWNVLLEQTEVDPVGTKVPLILQVIATGSEFKMIRVDAASGAGSHWLARPRHLIVGLLFAFIRVSFNPCQWLGTA